jgi:hypothetical protein
VDDVETDHYDIGMSPTMNCFIDLKEMNLEVALHTKNIQSGKTLRMRLPTYKEREQFLEQMRNSTLHIFQIKKNLKETLLQRLKFEFVD